MDECVAELLHLDLIRRSKSPWGSAPVLVENKTGGYRLAINYQPLNECMKVPVYLMPVPIGNLGNG